MKARERANEREKKRGGESEEQGGRGARRSFSPRDSRSPLRSRFNFPTHFSSTTPSASETLFKSSHVCRSSLALGTCPPNERISKARIVQDRIGSCVRWFLTVVAKKGKKATLREPRMNDKMYILRTVSVREERHTYASISHMYLYPIYIRECFNN